MIHVTPEHLNFVEEAGKAFEQNARFETYINEEETLIALRYGEDRDCIVVYELGEGIANFTQQVDVKYPVIRKEVARFARNMEDQLRANEHKGGWKDASEFWLLDQIKEKESILKNTFLHGTAKEVIQISADIANYAMMIADIAFRSMRGERHGE